MDIGIIVGSFKPLTIGHQYIIDSSSKECDLVYLFVSTQDRTRKNEMPVYWESQMKLLWLSLITPNINNNVKVVFTSNPTTTMLQLFHYAEDMVNGVDDNYYVYTDQKDGELIKSNRFIKQFPRLSSNNLVHIKQLPRVNGNTSATLLRKYIFQNNIKEVEKMIPSYMIEHIHLYMKLMKRT